MRISRRVAFPISQSSVVSAAQSLPQGDFSCKGLVNSPHFNAFDSPGLSVCYGPASKRSRPMRRCKQAPRVASHPAAQQPFSACPACPVAGCLFDWKANVERAVQFAAACAWRAPPKKQGGRLGAYERVGQAVVACVAALACCAAS